MWNWQVKLSLVGDLQGVLCLLAPSPGLGDRRAGTHAIKFCLVTPVISFPCYRSEHLMVVVGVNLRGGINSPAVTSVPHWQLSWAQLNAVHQVGCQVPPLPTQCWTLVHTCDDHNQEGVPDDEKE